MDRVRGQTKLQGLRFFRPIRGLLGELRKHCPHHNRTLHFDEYLVLLLLSFYNPSLKSLRGLVKCSDTPLAERNLGLHHTSLGSLSEASQVFDPGLLRHMFIELAGQALAADATPRPKGFPADLKILAADATLWRLLPRMARDLYVKPLTRARKGALKGHFIFNVLRGIPEDVEWTGGAVDERSVLPGQLARGALLCGGPADIIQRPCLIRLLKPGASFVMRLAKTYTYETIEDRPIGSAGEKAGVYSDALVKFTGVEPALRVVRARRVAPPSRNLHPLRKGGKHASPARRRAAGSGLDLNHRPP